MRALAFAVFISSLFLCHCQAFADQCGDAVNRYNSANHRAKSSFSDALQREFHVSTLVKAREAKDFCKRILPIYRKQLSMYQDAFSLDRIAASVCPDRLVNADEVTKQNQDYIDVIQNNIKLCEDSLSGHDDTAESTEGAEEFCISAEESGAAPEFCRGLMQQKKAAADQKQLPVSQPLAAQPSQSVSCSDITGLGDGGPAPTNCSNGNTALAAAQRLQAHDPTAARAKYQEAADAYRRAGDSARANAMLALAQALIASLQPGSAPRDGSTNEGPASPPATSPSQAPEAAPGDQANAAPSDDAGSCPPAIPASSWPKRNADYCAKASASCWERGAALYGYLCTPDPGTATAAQDPNDEMQQRLRSTLGKIRPRSYKPPMSPQALTALALTACKDAADLLHCIDEAKDGILFGADGVVRAACASIADSIARHNQAVDEAPGPDWLKAEQKWVCAPDPDVRAECGTITDTKTQQDCVDAVYTRGPGAWSALRSTLQKSIDGSVNK